MSPRSCRIVAALLLAVLAFATPAAAENRCAAGGAPRPDEGGIGGTGRAPGDDAGGIGGTGHDSGAADGIGGTGHGPNDPDDSGVGGTGILAGDTGVIGTITGFASICVGGVEIHYDAASSVRIDGRMAAAADLAVGQVVEVVASGSGDELSARQIGVTHLVAGPVTRVDADANAVEIMGQRVRLSASTRGGDDGAVAASDYAPGAMLQVSGMRQPDGSIAASRLSESPAGEAWLSGTIGDSGGGAIAVAGTPVRVADAGILSSGDEVRVRGRWDGTRLVASEVERLPRLPFDGRLGRLEVEGFASAVTADAVRVGRYVFEVPSGDAADVLSATAAENRVRVEAVIEGGRARLERVAPAPPLPPRPERPNDAGGLRPMRGDRPGEHGGAGAGGGEMRPPNDVMRPEAMSRPDRPDRPGRPGLPDRPPPIERPALPDRPRLPDRPALPDRPPIPERPPRLERPPRPGP